MSANVDLNEIFKEILSFMPRVSLTLYYLLQQTTVKYIDERKTLKIGSNEIIIPAETDGLEIRLYKDWLNMPLEQKIGTVIHELLHILLRHPIRAKNIFEKHGYNVYIHYLTNIAMDAKVNHAVNELLGKSVKHEFRELFSEEELEKCSVEELAEKLRETYQSAYKAKQFNDYKLSREENQYIWKEKIP